MSEPIVFKQQHHLGVVTLNRPQALNALTLPMIQALYAQLKAWQGNSDVHAVVVQAVAGKAFCAGGDVRWLFETGRHDPAIALSFFQQEYRLNNLIYALNKPYIALMDGVTMGGGVGISLHGSHPVASERFLFAMPETGIGFFPDVGASYLLSRCPENVGLYLGLTGDRLGAADAYALGLVKHVIRACDHPLVIEQLIETDLSVNPYARITDRLQALATPMPPAQLTALRPTINTCFDKPDVESICTALLETGGEWERKVVEQLQKKAPLSLKVTLAQLQKARTMSLSDCLGMDYDLVCHFIQGHDFYEGVRAVLVDKDKTPHWQPSTLTEATLAQVLGYFTGISSQTLVN